MSRQRRDAMTLPPSLQYWLQFVLRDGIPMVAIQVVDYLLGRQVTLWSLLLVPAALAAWNYGRREAVVSGGTAIALLFADAVWVGGPFSALPHALLATANRCQPVVGLVALVSRCRAVSIERAERSVVQVNPRKT